jgi:pimeloyl-ACP methyl ester carboxylesterase
MKMTYIHEEVSIDDRKAVYKKIPNQSIDENTRFLFFVHGLGCSSEIWVPTINCLSTEYIDQNISVCAPDMPGYGNTPLKRNEQPFTMEELAKFNIQLIETLLKSQTPPKSVYVIANSMGCQVAMAMLRLWSDNSFKFTGIVLQGPTIGGEISGLSYFLRWCVDTAISTWSYIYSLMVKQYLKMGLYRWLMSGWYMINDYPLKNIKTTNSQRKDCILIIRGTRDLICTQWCANRFPEVLDEETVSIRLIPGSPHACQFMKPDEFSSILLEYINDE